MKFRKIILQFIKSAWRKLRLCFSSRKRRPSDFVEENPENSEDQNIKNSPPKESQTQVPTQDNTADAKPEDSKHKSTGQSSQKETDSSESPGNTKDEIPKTQDSTKNLEPQSGGDQNKPPGDHRGQRDGEDREDEPNRADKNNNPPTKPPPPQCRFICYEETATGRWAIALAVEAGQEAQSVRQGSTALSANDGRYILEDISAEVTVEFKGEHPPQSFQLLKEDKKKDKFVVFKMRKNWQGEGQKVKTPSSGDYVVFAHESCGKRINKEPPQEAEQCRYLDFIVHFFSISEDSERDGFENCSLPFSSAKRFSLKGKRFPDDSNLGELFGDDAPRLDDTEKWREISWIVIGRENGGKVLAKFRTKEKKTLGEVLGEHSGWFFIRIYDDNVDLLHSFDFRRAKGLKNIFVNNQPLGKVVPIVPEANGHTKTIVQFEGDLSVRPADDSDGICEEPKNKNTFAVSPHPNNDGTKWILGDGENRVEAEILLPRIWWKFIEEEGKEDDWQATPIKMKREKLRGAKNEKIRIRLPLCIPEIAVGFGDLNSPDNPTNRTKLSKDRKTREVEFRLDDFAFDQAIEKPIRKAIYLRVKLKVKDSDIVFPIVHIPPDPKPKPEKIILKIGKGCNLLELKRAKEELYQEGRIAAAKAAGKFRAKGLKETILFDNIQKCLTIPFDPRRKSMEANNVEKLKAFFKKHFGKE